MVADHAVPSRNERRRTSEEVAESTREQSAQRADRTANTVGRVAARLAAADQRLAGLIREEQDATERVASLERELVAVAQNSAPEAGAIVAELDRLAERLAGLRALLERDFPGFADLAGA